MHIIFFQKSFNLGESHSKHFLFLINLLDSHLCQLILSFIKGKASIEFGLLENVQFRLDLFIVRPETWGVQFAIRTGPPTPVLVGQTAAAPPARQPFVQPAKPVERPLVQKLSEVAMDDDLMMSQHSVSQFSNVFEDDDQRVTVVSTASSERESARGSFIGFVERKDVNDHGEARPCEIEI